MEFIDQLKAFRRKSAENLTPNAIAIYFELFMTNNGTGWKEWFEQSDFWLGKAVGIKRRETILSALNLLKQKGFIDFERGGLHKPTRYRIIPLINSAITSANNSAITSANNSAITSANNSAITSANNSAITSDNPRHKTKTKDNRQVNNKGADVFAGESERVQEALRAFVEMRQKMRKPMTDRAKELLLHKLEGLSGGDEFMKVQLLEQSIERGWLSVFPLDMNQKQKLSTGNPQNNPHDDIAKAIAFFESQEGTA